MPAKLSEGDTVGMAGEVTMVHSDGRVTLRRAACGGRRGGHGDRAAGLRRLFPTNCLSAALACRRLGCARAVCRELKVQSHPDDLARALKNPAWSLARVGLEAGPLSQWLFSGLAEAGLPAICIETRHAKAIVTAQINKSDRNDARGIEQMMRVNLFRPVHVKTLTSQKRRVLLTARKLLQEKAIAIENDIRGLLRNFGLKVGTVAGGQHDTY